MGNRTTHGSHILTEVPGSRVSGETPPLVACKQKASIKGESKKQPKCPSTDEWIKKMWYIYTMEYYSAIKKNEIMSFAATWMDLEIIILSEVSQKKKDKYHMISLICGI